MNIVLRSRIIPALLLKDGGLVKTVRFSNPTYVGDPINAVRIFNEKMADELLVLDIEATSKNNEPNYSLIGKLARECRMPLCYGGGIKNIEQAKKIIGLGVEKIALSSAILSQLNFIDELVQTFGSQSIVAVLDVKKSFLGKYSVFTHNGKIKVKNDISDLLLNLEKKGVGEIVINSIDNDGVMKGFDINLIQTVYSKVSIPLTVLGGAGKKEDIFRLTEMFGVIGIAIGSLFVFKGRYKAVLISYLSQNDRDLISKTRY